MTRYRHRTKCVLALTVCLLGLVPNSLAQGNYGRSDLLDLLIKGDLASIPQDQANYFAVLTSITAIGNSQCMMHQPNLSLYRPYYSYILERFRKKTKFDTPFSLIPALNHPRFSESMLLLISKGCDSMEIQAILVNGFKFGLGQEPVDLSGPYPLDSEDVHDAGPSIIDYYCKFDGRKDPACAKLKGFLFGRSTPSCFDGLQIPAAPKPPQVMVCHYVKFINAASGWKSDRRYTYWYKRVPANLNDLRVYGVDQFSSVAPVALTNCPSDSGAAEKLFGDRNVIPTMSGHGGMPTPHPSLTVDRCVHDRHYGQPVDLTEGDYKLTAGAHPAMPPEARSRGLEGYVDVSLTVTIEGKVKDVVVVSSTNEIFDQAAIDTALQYRYKPRVVDGQPIEVTGVKERISFRKPVSRRRR